MRKILFYAGIVVILIGLVPLLKYALDYADLSTYGKGYVWGKVFIASLGVLLMVISSRLKK